MGLGEAEAEKLEFAALVHNLGRVAVPDSILQKTGTLTQEELEAVRAATLKGADWLSSVEGMDGVAAIVRHQNESYDGSGLPDGLRGEEIPLGARILAVATRFAAMTSPRADRGPRPVVGGALDGLVGQSGTSLDPKVVEAFVHAMGRSL
jgi:response regulator RpfG family c-di-GMP phosphodiesterase